MEVLLGAGYGTPADIWSTACMVSVTSLNIAEKEIDITNVMDIILSC
jgi:hypothetical protein